MESSDAIDLIASEVQRGEDSNEHLVREVMTTVLAVPTPIDPGQGSFQPVLVDVEGVTHMVVATSTAGLDKSSAVGTFAVTLFAADVIRRLDAAVGLWVDTASTSSTLSPRLLSELRAEH
ncbi:hypothetical protein [Psychromicrobium xiongbiense]|uniref:hypothetical protein n=1 Tax=Psychromicrobium xiongbiense TaxID=3051184 RepID=UPI00255455F6|nr:hypothetical protein [Psychromicrobium sp. YIM S02556]